MALKYLFFVFDLKFIIELDNIFFKNDIVYEIIKFYWFLNLSIQE